MSCATQPGSLCTWEGWAAYSGEPSILLQRPERHTAGKCQRRARARTRPERAACVSCYWRQTRGSWILRSWAGSRRGKVCRTDHQQTWAIAPAHCAVAQELTNFVTTTRLARSPPESVTLRVYNCCPNTNETHSPWRKVFLLRYSKQYEMFSDIYPFLPQTEWNRIEWNKVYLEDLFLRATWLQYGTVWASVNECWRNEWARVVKGS